MTLKFMTTREMTTRERTAHGVGLALYAALLNAGREGWHTLHTDYDFFRDEIMVRFDRDPADKRERSVYFRIPGFVSDPVEYATAKWPEWFSKRQQIEQQLELDI